MWISSEIKVHGKARRCQIRDCRVGEAEQRWLHVPKGEELDVEEERVDGWKKGSSTKGRNQEEKERVDGLEEEREGIRSLGEEERRRWQVDGDFRRCLAGRVFLFWVQLSS